MAAETLTRLGLFLAKRAVNKSMLAKKTKIGTDRLSQLTINPNTHLRVREMYLIALAIEADPSELLQFICDDIRLPKSDLEK